jgi:DNA primase
LSAIDDIKSRIDIVDLVSEHVPLQRAGRNYKAACPFHAERTPSFIVSPDRQTWHCFGACSTGGDIFTFVMKREGVDFAEALRTLAQRAGIQLGEPRRADVDEQNERLYQANEAAAAFFHNALLTSRPAAQARDYLARRGLDQEAIEAFQLGYSPDSWDTLKSHLEQRGFTPAEQLAAGLLVESDRGGYDRFRGRLMFPIRNERGRVAGFGARSLDSETSGQPAAKYINTPQTPIFDKGRLLYGLHRARDAIRRERRAIVVEGYMDVIAAHQHGVQNTVASMGTALTDRQIRALDRLHCTVLLALDADAAGIEATLRALQEAGAAGAVRALARSPHPADLSDEEFSERVKDWSRDGLKRAAVTFYVVPLSGKDPDEMIRADRDAWDRAVANAKPFTDHVFDVVASRIDRSHPAGRAELLRQLLPVVRLIDEPVYRAHYVQRLSRLALVDEDAVRAELRRPVRAPRPLPPPQQPPARRAQREPAEEFCLALLLRHTELEDLAAGIDADLFSLGEHRAIFDALRDAADLDEVRDRLPDELHPALDAILAHDLPVLEGTLLRDAFADCVRRIELRRLLAAKQALAASLAEPGAKEHMTAAVQEALSRRSNAPRPRTSPSSPADAQVDELAARLVEDDELGRRLHEAALRRISEAREAAPQGEGQR